MAHVGDGEGPPGGAAPRDRSPDPGEKRGHGQTATYEDVDTMTAQELDEAEQQGILRTKRLKVQLLRKEENDLRARLVVATAVRAGPHPLNWPHRHSLNVGSVACEVRVHMSYEQHPVGWIRLCEGIAGGAMDLSCSLPRRLSWSIVHSPTPHLCRTLRSSVGMFSAHILTPVASKMR